MSGDYHALMNLINTYPLFLDTGNHEGIGKLFSHGSIQGVYQGQGGDVEPAVGSEAVKQFYDDRVMLYDGQPLTRHVITNVVIDIAEDRATARARSYFHVIQKTPTLPLQIIVSGRYEDQFKKIEGEWWFSGKKVMPDHVGDASGHINPFWASGMSSQAEHASSR